MKSVRSSAMTVLLALAIRRFAGGLLMLALLLVPVAAGAGGCLQGGQMRRAVERGDALPLGSIKRQLGGRIVRADLCQRGDRLVYLLAVLSGTKVDQLIIDARSGSVIGRR